MYVIGLWPIESWQFESGPWHGGAAFSLFNPKSIFKSRPPNINKLIQKVVHSFSHQPRPPSNKDSDTYTLLCSTEPFFWVDNNTRHDQSSRCCGLSRRALSNSVHHHHRPRCLGSIFPSPRHRKEFTGIRHPKWPSRFIFDIDQSFRHVYFDHMGEETYYRMGMDS